MTSGSRNVGEDVASGVLTGLAGPDVGLDAYGVSGQKKQTAVQEWTQWKQWALNHKDFEDFRAILKSFRRLSNVFESSKSDKYIISRRH